MVFLRSSIDALAWYCEGNDMLSSVLDLVLSAYVYCRSSSRKSLASELRMYPNSHSARVTGMAKLIRSQTLQLWYEWNTKEMSHTHVPQKHIAGEDSE